MLLQQPEARSTGLQVTYDILMRHMCIGIYSHMYDELVDACSFDHAFADTSMATSIALNFVVRREPDDKNALIKLACTFAKRM